MIEALWERFQLEMSFARKVIAVIAARNEDSYIAETILALKGQTLPPEKIVVVDDGSTDRTAEIAEKMECDIVRLGYHEESYVGKPELARVFNTGLFLVDEDADYVLILGADHRLPPHYVRLLVERMENNPDIVVASGRIEREPYVEDAPRGSGRLVDAKFWREVNGIQYPVEWGWESWLVLKAMQMNREVRCFRDIVTKISRETSLSKSLYLGKAMYALGYRWYYALGRILLTFLKSPKAGLEMFWGWFNHEGAKRLDVANWVADRQKKIIWERIWSVLRRGGRR